MNQELIAQYNNILEELENARGQYYMQSTSISRNKDKIENLAFKINDLEEKLSTDVKSQIASKGKEFLDTENSKLNSEIQRRTLEIKSKLARFDELNKLNIKSIEEEIMDKYKEIDGIYNFILKVKPKLEEQLGKDLIDYMDKRCKVIKSEDISLNRILKDSSILENIEDDIDKYSYSKNLSVGKILDNIIPSAEKMKWNNKVWIVFYYGIFISIMAVVILFKEVLVPPLLMAIIMLDVYAFLNYYKLFKVYVPFKRVCLVYEDFKTKKNIRMNQIYQKRNKELKDKRTKVIKEIEEELNNLNKEEEEKKLEISNKFRNAIPELREIYSEDIQNEISNCKKEIEVIENIITDTNDKMAKLEVMINKILTDKKDIKIKIEESIKEGNVVKEVIIPKYFYLGEDNREQLAILELNSKGTIIWFSSKEERSNSDKFTGDILKLLIYQIFSSMKPNTYNIKVIDTEKSGLDISLFTNANEAKAYNVTDDQNLTIANTSSDVSKLINYIDEQVTERMEVISSGSKSLEEYNQKQISTGSSIKKFIFLVGSKSTIEILKEETVNRIFNLSESVGIIPIFLIDIELVTLDRESHGLISIEDLTTLFENLKMSKDVIKNMFYLRYKTIESQKPLERVEYTEVLDYIKNKNKGD